MKTYAEKLRDPRWQKKRLEVMERDNWVCKRCSREDETLNVHHVVYKKGNDPWDYPEFLLLTLCEPCHAEVESDSLKAWAGMLRSAPIHRGILECAINSIITASESVDGAGLEVEKPKTRSEAYRGAMALLCAAANTSLELAVNEEHKEK